MLEELIKRLKDFKMQLEDVCVFPALLPDEQYAGIVLNGKGEPDYHLVVKDLKVEKAFQVGADLPTTKEIMLVFVQLGKLNHRRYWLKSWAGEQVTSDGRFVHPGKENEHAGVLEVRRIPV